LLLGLASAMFLGSESHEVMFYCSKVEAPNMEDQVPIFISPRERVAQLNLQAVGGFVVEIP
jgi:hypothetical protein